MPAKTIKDIEVIFKEQTKNNYHTIVIYSNSFSKPIIQGVAYLDGNEIYAIWANHGYGPILFHIIFEITGGCSIGGDGCTLEAEMVLKEFYCGKGKSNVIIEDRDGFYDEKYLNAFYKNKVSLIIPKNNLSIEIQNKIYEDGCTMIDTKLRNIYNS